MMDKYEIIPRRVWLEDDSGYVGEGRSKLLARGLLLWAQGKNQTGEGMGLGAIAVIQDGSAYFSGVEEGPARAASPESLASSFQKTFSLNRKSTKFFGGIPAPLLTRLGDRIVSCYMKHSWLQKSILHPGIITLCQKILSIRTGYMPCPPQALGQLQYTLEPGKITISGKLKWLTKPPEKVYLLNELSSAFLDAGWSQGAYSKPPAGWVKASTLGDDFLLASSSSGIAMEGSDLVASSGKIEKYYGREQADDLGWAGIIYEISLPREEATALEPLSFSYVVKVRDIYEAS